MKAVLNFEKEPTKEQLEFAEKMVGLAKELDLELEIGSPRPPK